MKASPTIAVSQQTEEFPDVLTVEQCCRFLGVHRNTLSQLMHQPDGIPYRRIGKRYGVRFLKRAVEAWLAGESDRQPAGLRRVV